MACLAVGATLPGCKVLPVLTTAPGTPTAMLRWKTNASVGTMYRVNIQQCPSTPTMEIVALSSDEELAALNMIDAHPKPRKRIKERLIPAGKPFVFLLHAYEPSSHCDSAGVFVPKASVQYEVFHELGWNSCQVQFVTLGLDANGYTTRTPVEEIRRLPFANDLKDYCQVAR